MPYIVHYFNGEPIGHIELNDRLTIGRGDGNDLQIDDATISHHHAVIEQIDDGYQIRDLNSTNGVLCCSQKVQCQRLNNGDFMLIGTHNLQFVITPPERLAQTAKIRKSWIPGLFFTRG